MRKLLLLLLVTPFLFGEITKTGAMKVQRKPRSGWSHLELGASNYNPTKSSYKGLIAFVKDYVELNGPKGTFHINDLAENTEPLEKLADILRNLAKEEGWKGFKVEILPGDFTQIKYPDPLNTVSLRNPEVPTFKQLDDARKFSDLLKMIAAKASDGLIVSSYAYPEMAAAKEVGRVPVICTGKGAPYYLPDGKRVPLPTFNFLVSENPPSSIEDVTAKMDGAFEKHLANIKPSLGLMPFRQVFHMTDNAPFMGTLRKTLRAYATRPRDADARSEQDSTWMHFYYDYEQLTYVNTQPIREHFANCSQRSLTLLGLRGAGSD